MATGGSGEPASPWASTGAVPTVSGQQVDGPGVLKREGAAGTNWSGCSIGPLKLFLEKKLNTVKKTRVVSILSIVFVVLCLGPRMSLVYLKVSSTLRLR